MTYDSTAMTEATPIGASDSPEGSWVDRLTPVPMRPYLRLARVDRPIGTWLLLIPCWWGTALASPSWPSPWLFALFAAGALVMRGAGCTVNDLADREFDSRGARTAGRPIASGQVSVGRALAFLLLQLAVGLLVLIQFNPVTIALGAVSLPLVALYPFMKRVTHWPQLVLGFTFNWGALMGWAAVTGGLAWPAVALYGAGVFWTLGYDTIYAHQDKEDDARIGLKSLALRLGDGTKPWLAGFYGVTLLLLGAAGHFAGLGWPYGVALLVALAHLAWQVHAVDLDDPKDCLLRFRSNRDLGLIVLVGIALGRLAA